MTRSSSQYEWHQSHDQATVLLLIEQTQEYSDVEVIIESNFIQAGIKGQPPIVKGLLYGDIDPKTSIWNIGGVHTRRSPRERTTSSTSSHSSFAFVSEPDVSVSFAASTASSARESDVDDFHDTTQASGPGDPPTNGSERRRDRLHALSPTSYPSSLFSSLESLHSLRAPRLLMTIHLQKAEPGIWPTLITSARSSSSSSLESSLLVDKYDMDTTSLSGLGLHLLDIQKDKEEAFEHFIRAWQRGRTPLAAVKLVYVYYNPLLAPGTPDTSATSDSSPTAAYYLDRIGGRTGLAQLYLEAGLLHLDGTASQLLSKSPALSSIKLPTRYMPGASQSGSDRWREDRETATRYFEHARSMDPLLEVPTLEPDRGNADWHAGDEFMMPQMELAPSTRPESRASSVKSGPAGPTSGTIRRRKPDRVGSRRDTEEADNLEEDNTWYLYLPAAVGAGTALLVIGIVSLSSWRKTQGS